MNESVKCPACGRHAVTDGTQAGPAKRITMFREHPSLLAVHALSGAEGGEAGSLYDADEHERAMCKAWLHRLVDGEGNPLDDAGHNALEHAAIENTIGAHGSLSYIGVDVDRATLSITVLRAAAHANERVDLRDKLREHACSYVDLLLDQLYDTPREPPTMDEV